MIPLSLIIFPILTVDLANVLLAVLFGSADAIVSFCGFLVAFTVGFGVTVGVLDVSAAGVTVGVTVGVGVGTISSPSDHQQLQLVGDLLLAYESTILHIETHWIGL